MEISLPDIDPQRISDPYAKQCVMLLMNAYEMQLQQITLLNKQVQELREEVAHLSGQARKPKIQGKKKRENISVTKLLHSLSNGKKKGKKKKKQIAVDKRIRLETRNECNCGEKTFEVIRTETKIVQGILIKRNNIQYKRTVVQCKNCGKIHAAEFPNKGYSFDQSIRTLVSALGTKGRQSQAMLHEFLTGFGIDISLSEMDVIKRRNSEKLKPVVAHLTQKGIEQAPYLQTDATGSKRITKTGKVINQYMQVIRTEYLSLFRITRKYNIKTLNTLLTGKGRKKHLIADDHSVNNGCACQGLQLCLVHEIRLYKKLFPFFSSHQTLKTQILTTWRTFYHLAKQYTFSPPLSNTQNRREAIIRLFEELTSKKTGYKELDKQLSLSRQKKEKLLYFLDHPQIPIHNNGCEQDLREYVTLRKVLGPTRSMTGDMSLARHLSVIQTIKKQQLPLFQTLHGLLSGELSPAILTIKY
jgi:transposase IS66 family protein